MNGHRGHDSTTTLPCSTTRPLNNPGDGASTVKIPAFLNSLPRWLLKVPCNIQVFLRSILMTRVRSVDTTSMSRSTWPMPLPFPEVFKAGCHSKVSRSHVKRLVSLQIMVLDWFVLGRPTAAPDYIRIGSKLTARQWRVVRRFEDLVLDGNTPQFIDAKDMGRSAAKNESHEEALGALCRAASMVHVFDNYGGGNLRRPGYFNDEWLRCGSLVGRLPRGNPCTAKPIVSSRITVPDCPRFDPIDLLDSVTKEKYLKPKATGYNPQDVGIPPRVQLRASAPERLLLLKKLCGAGMLRPLVNGSFATGFENGMFAVNKDAERDRLVLDSRASNMLDPGQSVWSQAMASATALAGIYLQPKHVLTASGEDLKDYFYQFVVSEERIEKNVLCTKLSQREASYVFEQHFSEEQCPLAVGLSTLAMGDICAVEFAQCSHLALCLRNHVMKVNEIITLKGSIPRGLLHTGIIVDDLIILEQMTKECYDTMPPGSSNGSKRTAKARGAYVAASLPHNPKKGFVDELHSRFWGIEIDGLKGTLRSSSLRLWPTCLITMRVCSLGLATVGLLEALAGSWVALLSIRRRLFSVMEIVFEPLGIDDQKAVIRLSPELKDELISFVVIATLAVVNLRAEAAEFVVATDASTSALAAVKANLDSPIVEELTRHCLRKGAWSKLLLPHAAWLRQKGLLDVEDELPEGAFKSNPLWETMARSLTYTTSWKKMVRRDKHINILELQAFLKEEKRLCESKGGLRIPFALDSQVALGTVVKGRASSRVLNDLMRQSMAFPLGADVYEFFMYYPSEFNRADGPTRDRDPDGPDLEKPAWMSELAKGKYDLFDAWMDQNCRHFVRSSIPFDEIGCNLDIKPNRIARRLQRSRQKLNGSSQITSGTMRPSAVAGELHEAPVTKSTNDQCSKESEPYPQRHRWACDDSPAGVCSSQNRVSSGAAPRRSSILSEEALQLLDALPKSQFFFSPGFKDFTVPGALDLFSGRCGVAREMIACGAPWILVYDIERGPGQDLLQQEVRDVIRKLLMLGAFSTLGAAPICSSFSVAVTPPVRSSQFPRGLPGLRRNIRVKVQQGNSHNDFVYELVVIAEGMSVYYWIENPDTSWWWRQKKWRRFRSTLSPHIFRCCFCRFGTRWKKPTRIATNTKIRGLKLWCTCRTPHTVLRGNHPTRRIPWTLVAQPYPRGLCRILAAALCIEAQWCTGDKLNIAGCARVGSLRIGEAANPGPRRRVHRDGTLEDQPLQRPQTLALEARLLNEFLQWVRGYVNYNTEELFSLLPEFLATCLRCYGDLLYQTGGALSNLRHLLLAAQRWRPAVRPFMSQAWEMVDRWSAITPVNHRIPVPEVLVKAMCAISWHWGWYAWTGATILAFYGAGRLGEVLKCSREDLLLPEDLLEPSDSPTFLRLRQFKSKNRQPAKVQHMRISDATASRILSRIFIKVPMTSLLFDSTPYQYRKRWDAILATLGFDAKSGLTPGGLRGGSAVFHYRKGKPIGDLLWLLRLRSQSTLESYLQEVASLNVLAKLPESMRRSVFATAAIFDHLAAAKLQPGLL